MDDLKDLAERIARLERWANSFSCSIEHGDPIIFVTKADEDAIEQRMAELKSRATLSDNGGV